VLIGTLYLIFAQIIFLACNLVLHVYMGRTLGPELYGAFGVINALILLNEILLFRSVYDTLSQFVAGRKAAARAILNVTLKWQVLIGLAACSANFLLAPQLARWLGDPSLSVYIRLSSLMLP